MNHVPKLTKEKAFKTFKGKIMGLYKWVKDEEESEGEPEEERNEESFNPLKLEQAFDRAYRNYRVNGRSRIDVVPYYYIYRYYEFRDPRFRFSKGTKDYMD